MSEEKDKEKGSEKIKKNIKAKIDLLENILASDTDIDLFEKVEEVNTKYYNALQNLKEARPVFANCDQAFTSVSEKLLRNFELVYSLLEAQYRGEVERRIAFLEAVNERIVPFYWNTKWLHKPRQNYAATLIDMEADEVMKKVFEKKELEIFEKYLKSQIDEHGVLRVACAAIFEKFMKKGPPQDQNASREEDFEIIGGLGEEPAGEAESAPQGAEQAEGREEVAPAQESAHGAESPQNAQENAGQTGEKNAVTAPNTTEAPAEGSKKASVSDSEREGDKIDGEKVGALAEKAPESVSKTVQEGENPPNRARRKKSKKGEEVNDCESNSA